MGMVVRTNTMAINAQRQLNLNNNAVSKSLEKLASGYKINRAADDAAGLAISERMKAQIAGLEAASSNSQDGISVVQTAEGALNEVHDMLNRMVELATKAANGVYTDTQRQNYADEVAQLQDEIDRIAESTNFNGIKLLDGTMGLNTNAITVVGKQVAAEGGTIATTGWGAVGDVQNTNIVLHEDPIEQKGTIFTVDLNSVTFTASATNQTITLNVGGAQLTVTASAPGDIAQNGLATFFAAAGASGVVIDGATFSVTASNGTLTFTMQTNSIATAGNTALSGNFDVTLDLATGSTGTIIGTQDIAVTNITQGQKADSGALANAFFDIDVSRITDGATLKIGAQTYVFKVGHDSTLTADANQTLVDLSRFEQNELAANKSAVYAELTKAANTVQDTDRTWDLGVNTAGQLTITENASAADYANNDFTTETAIRGSVVFTTSDIAGGTTLKIDGANLVDGNAISVNGTQYIFTTNAANTGSEYIQIGNGTSVLSDLATKLQANGLTVEQQKDGSLFISSNNAPVEILGGGLTLQVGDTSDDFNKLNVSVNDMHADALGVAAHQIDITTQEGAGAAIDIINNAIDSVSRTRSSLGAIQNRLEHTINSLDTTTENLQSANSRIRDTDMAKEMMEYTKMNVLVQSAQAMLAQANQQPQSVLQLLQ